MFLLILFRKYFKILHFTFMENEDTVKQVWQTPEVIDLDTEKTSKDIGVTEFIEDGPSVGPS